MSKQKTLSREEAAELYRDVRKAMSTVKSKPTKTSKIVTGPDLPPEELKVFAKSIAQSISKSMANDKQPPPEAVKSFAREETADAIERMQLESETSSSPMPQGQLTAIAAVLLFAGFKVFLGILEVTGLASATPVEAAMMSQNRPAQIAQVAGAQGFSKDEIRLLTQLDQRRAELEERSRKLDTREAELGKRDNEFVTKLTELRELTSTLRVEREKGEKKKSSQLEQLANVYGSMAPNEAATLMEQLDVTIALDLLSRMPEKRIGQILALMHPERALTITKMLSGKIER